ncbi:MAG: thiamine pyrophosphate-binding protein [Nostoc sp.]|uniref:thiamine pyrophosphate-binding protein n=1 Tax=Nostoc sp. TaxID=1180 RepID=UPI002FF0EE3E
MKLSDALVKALISLNVRYVFGVSGANIEHLHNAIYRLGKGKLQSVMAKSEDGGGFHGRQPRTGSPNVEPLPQLVPSLQAGNHSWRLRLLFLDERRQPSQNSFPASRLGTRQYKSLGFS